MVLSSSSRCKHIVGSHIGQCCQVLLSAVQVWAAFFILSMHAEVKKASVPHVTCTTIGSIAVQEHAPALLCRAGSILQGLFGMQAFRHLYALAAEPRCLEAVDVDTRQSVSVPVRITLDPTAVGQVTISFS